VVIAALNAPGQETEMDNTSIAKTLADQAGLPLAPGRAEIAGGLLADWVKAANELSLKMSAAQHQQLLPATVFTHMPTQTQTQTQTDDEA